AKFSDDALKKRMERARKMFKIFNTIGKEKIAQVKSIPPGFILNLTVDDTDYVIAEVLKGSG
ncbi:38567_t:CDS:1, partial [Gigaspora margarita]